MTRVEGQGSAIAQGTGLVSSFSTEGLTAGFALDSLMSTFQPKVPAPRQMSCTGPKPAPPSPGPP